MNEKGRDALRAILEKKRNAFKAFLEKRNA